jgi:glycosyltransferase involved in cell wall biosynthesis
MKVLHVINSLNIGGAEKLLKEMLPLLHGKGLYTELLLLNGEETYFTKELADREKIIIHAIGKRNNIYNPLIIFRLIPYLQQFDIINVHLFPAQYWVAIAKMVSRSKAILVTTEHSTSNRRRTNLIFKILDRFIYSRFKVIIAVSERAAENLRVHLRDFSQRIKVIENGINFSIIYDSLPYLKTELVSNCNDDTKFLLKVARFCEAKDHLTVLKAMLLLPENVHLLLVGEGELKDHFFNIVSENNLGHRVHFLGIRNDVNRLLKSSEIIIMSSFYEGLSLSCLEGMASGKPFISSDVIGLHEIVNEAGILFKQGDFSELAAIITKLFEDKEMYNQVAMRCLQRAKQFDIEKTVNSYLRIYNLLKPE